MATWRAENSMLTSRGVEILNKIKSGVGDITVTRVVASSGRVSPDQLYNQSQLSGVTKDLTLSRVNTFETGSEISVYMDNSNFTESFDLHQIGVFVTHPDYNEEQLYHISQCEAEDFDTIPALGETPVTFGYSLFLEHGNSESIHLTVDPQGMIPRSEFEQYAKRFTPGRFFMKSSDMVSLSSEGWYRVATVENKSGNLSALLFLGHNYNDVHSGLTVSVDFQMYAPSIVVLNNRVPLLAFLDKIRVVQDSANSKFHLDIHCNSNTPKNFNITAGIVYFDYNADVGVHELAMKDFIEVEEAPTGETIFLTQQLSLTKNGTILTTGSSPDDIKAAPAGLVDTTISVTSETDLDAKLDSIVAKMGNKTTKFVMVVFSSIHPALGGSNRIMRIDRIEEKYCVIHSLGFSYSGEGIVLEHFRSKWDGMWTPWARGYNTAFKPTPADIGAFGTTKGVVSSVDLNTFKDFSSQRFNNPLNRPSGTGENGLAWNIRTIDESYLVQYYLDATSRELYRRTCVWEEWSEWIAESTTPVVPATVE